MSENARENFSVHGRKYGKSRACSKLCLTGRGWINHYQIVLLGFRLTDASLVARRNGFTGEHVIGIKLAVLKVHSGLDDVSLDGIAARRDIDGRQGRLINALN